MKTASVFASAVVLLAASAAVAGTLRLQNGTSPAPDYAGCVDTRISVYNDQEARGPRNGDGKTSELRTFSTARRILVRFDLSPIPADQPIRRALLRVYCIDATSLSSSMQAAPLTQAWDESATGFEHTKTDDEKTPAGNWATKGGDYDDKAVLTAPCRGGPFGQGFEFDVTGLVADWRAGKRPNHGLILWSCQHTEHRIASSEWFIPSYRPELLVEAGGAEELTPWAAAPAAPALSPVAATPAAPDKGLKPATIRWGNRNDAQFTAPIEGTYYKTSPKFPGDWSWMPMLRIGGGAGDTNTAAVTVDLTGVSADAAVGSAKLRLYVVAGSKDARFGAYLPAPAPAGGPVRAQGLPVAVAKAVFPPPKDADPRPYIEWDITGAARANLGKRLTLVLNADLEGGSLDVYSSRYDDPALRPVLEMAVAADVKVPAPTAGFSLLEAPAGDYWVEPMKRVHARFAGTAGALGQYGDSITITMAFMAPHSYGKTCIPATCPPEVAEKLKVLDAHAKRDLWNKWKDPEYGNNGSMTIAWAFANVDSWQKVCKPEVAVILFGTNDVSYGPVPPDHTEMLAAVVDRCLADGTIPMLTTLPPRGDQKRSEHILNRVREIRRAQLAVARAKQIPLIDLYAEMLSRQPEEWDKILMGDTLHPSYRDPWKMDFTAEGLKNSGYTLRSYLTMMRWVEVIEKVIQPAPIAAAK
ncbi:MAG TPA: DNRLRE domain-containing protein [Phycisphaerae bacterium]|nr:DNRLRE domain-containing protein [Phycisphaerae bacterium]